MDPIALFLLIIAAIFMIGTLGEIVFQWTRIPDVVWLLLVGILLGPVTNVVSRDQLAAIAPYFGALTLVVILFDGGIQLNIREISRSAPRSSLLALLSFSMAVIVVAGASMLAGAVGWLPSEWTWRHAILLGTILGGSSSIVIMPTMALGRVKESVANLVNLESALTDAFCVVGTVVMINIILHGEEGAISPGMVLARSFYMGIGIGLAAGFIWLIFLRLFREGEHTYLVTLSALLLLYVGIDHAGGSAALGILAFAIVVGNAGPLGKIMGFRASLNLGEDVRGFHRQVSFIIKSFFFTFMGAMLAPPWPLIALGFLLGAVLLAARVPPVWLALLGSGLRPKERKLVLVAMPRGMAAGVLATMPFAAGVSGSDDIPIVVFAAALTTILIFTVGFAVAAQTGENGVESQPQQALSGVAPSAAQASDPPEQSKHRERSA